MNYFGITSYDPVDGSSTSIDPLNSLSTSVRLAEFIFPGASGRIWKIRYLSAICFLLKVAKTTNANSQKENYLNYRNYENVLILTSALMKKNQGEITGLDGLMGTSKAGRLIENSSRGYVDIAGEILSNQANLGPLGVYLVFLRSLGLVDEDNITLTNAGEELANLYSKNMQDSAKVIEELGSKNKVEIEKLKSRINPQNFSFHLTDKQNEADFIFNLIVEHPKRLQLIKDVNLARTAEENEETFIKNFYHLNNSENSNYYKLIFHFEILQRILHNFFYHFLISPLPISLHSHKEAQTYLKSNLNNLLSHAKSFKQTAEELSPEDLYELRTFLTMIDEVIARVISFEDFTNYIISKHIGHQKHKNKAPWIRLENEKLIANATNLRNLEDINENALHRFRISNANFILTELGKKNAK